MTLKRCYRYDGPVTQFGVVITERWSSSTYAESEARARSNLIYQFKKKYGKAPGAKINLPGKLTLGN